VLQVVGDRVDADLMSRRDLVWRRIFTAVLGAPPARTTPGFEVAKLRYLRRCFIRLLLPPTLAICAACLVWGPVIELPFTLVLLAVWVAQVTRINARIRRALARQPSDPEARTSSTASGVRS
jgi:hypothetical protein